MFLKKHLTLLILLVLALLSCAAFMTLGAKGSWLFILKFRGIKLAGLLLVAAAIAVSTVLFQTITNNKILTPSIMGFDALYVLLQTLMVAFIGSHTVQTMEPNLKYMLNVALMLAFSGTLFRWLFAGEERSLHLLVLVGIILGTFFRSISSFIQRVLDPNEFMVLQDMFFASFNTIDKTLIGISAIILGVAAIWTFALIPKLDVLSLGRPAAINLGINYQATVTQVLIICAVGVSVSTALVGPVTFFGLLVASLAYRLTPSAKHAQVLPAAILLAIITLVGGQTLLERVFSFNTALSILIEFLGGLTFIYLIIRRTVR